MTRSTLWRRLRMGLQTLLGPIFGLPRQGFFIPYRYAGTIPQTQGSYPDLEQRYVAAVEQFCELLFAADSFAGNLRSIAAETRPLAPRFSQSWFPTLDAVAAYTIVRQYRPQRIVEIGSGHSTRFLCRAVADGQLGTEITAIDPAPRAALTDLPISIVPAIVQMADPATFSALQAGDILFIDSSHILMPGTDVDWLFNRVLPVLPPGVLVHIHDIFLPDDYPADWGWRGYNEQQALGPLLAGGWSILFASHYVSTRLAAEVAASIAGLLPTVAESRPASLWLIRRA